jgi:hypothetical protein
MVHHFRINKVPSISRKPMVYTTFIKKKKKLNKQAKKMSWTNNLEIILGTKKIYLPVLNISRHHDFITGGAAKH